VKSPPQLPAKHPRVLDISGEGHRTRLQCLPSEWRWSPRKSNRAMRPPPLTNGFSACQEDLIPDPLRIILSTVLANKPRGLQNPLWPH
jgi:hypothetical protein